MPRQKGRWGKLLHQPAPPGDELSSEPRPSGRCRRRALRVAGNVSRELRSNLGEVGGRWGRGGDFRASRRGGRAPASPADLPEYPLMQPSPSPSQVWKSKRPHSLLLAGARRHCCCSAAGAPRRRRHHAPAPGSGGGGTRGRGRNSAGAPRRYRPGPSLTDDGACPARRAPGRGIPPLRVLSGLGRWALCNRRSR